MCGRYFFDPSREEWPALEEALKKRYGERSTAMARGEITPGRQVAVKANDKQLRPGWFLMKWGFQTAQGSRLLINARAETAVEKLTFSESMLYRRCLIPARGYYEWADTQMGRQKYMLWPAEKENNYLAGLYRHEQTGPALVVLTRPAAPSLSAIHERMPLILSEGHADTWLLPGAVSYEWMENAAVKELHFRAVHS